MTGPAYGPAPPRHVRGRVPARGSDQMRTVSRMFLARPQPYVQRVVEVALSAIEIEHAARLVSSINRVYATDLISRYHLVAQSIKSLNEL